MPHESHSLSVQLSEGAGLGPEADSMELCAARDLECNVFVGGWREAVPVAGDPG